MLLNNMFIIFGGLFVLSLTAGKMFVFKLKNTIAVSNYIALMTAFMAFYCIVGFILAFKVQPLNLKLIFFLSSLSPFILGQCAKYKTEKWFTLLQILVVIASICVCIHYF